MSYREEFPDFDPSTMPELPEGWTDISWHNDASPMFENPALGLRVWIDYAKPEDREFPETPRFGLRSVAEVEIALTDDWQEIIRLIGELELRPDSTRAQMGKWYSLMVGYDPTTDKPTMSDGELRELCTSYLHEILAENSPDQECSCAHTNEANCPMHGPVAMRAGQ